jgi:hypothetical protein
MTFWTQEISLRWRPEAAFFERWPKVLRALEDDGTIRSFRVGGPGDVEVGLVDRNHSLRLAPTSLTLLALTPEGVNSQVLAAVRQALTIIAPRSVRSSFVRFQNLVPLDVGYERARVEAAKTLFASWVEPVEDPDWAVLLNGRDAAWDYQIEFGIVSQAEIAERLARIVSRVDADEFGDPEHWSEVPLPEVAFFADSNWNSRAKPDGEPADVFEGFLQDCHGRALALVERLVVATGLGDPALSTTREGSE